MIVCLTQDIPPFVMYCVYGESGSSLLIESILHDSMILLTISNTRYYLVILVTRERYKSQICTTEPIDLSINTYTILVNSLLSVLSQIIKDPH